MLAKNSNLITTFENVSISKFLYTIPLVISIFDKN